MSAATFHFDSLESATEAFLVTVLSARTGDSVFRFSGLTTEQLFSSGLRLEGDIEQVASQIERIAGVVREESEETARG